MTRTQAWVAALPALALSALISPCGAAEKVQPQLNTVKKVAVVSVTSQVGVHALGKPATKTAQITTLVGMFRSKKKQADDPPANFGGNKLVSAGLDAFTEELGKVKGWEALAPAQFINTPAYEKFRAGIKLAMDKFMAGTVATVANRTTVQPAGMPFVSDAMSGRQILAELARDLDVDGVLFVSLDMAYGRGVYINGTGLTAAAVGYSAHMINRDGTLVLRAGGRKDSSDLTPMSMYNIAYSPQVEDMFVDSIRKDAAHLRAFIDERLLKGESAVEGSPNEAAAQEPQSPAPSTPEPPSPAPPGPAQSSQ